MLDSLFAANKKIACSGTGANLGFKDIDSSFLELINSKVSDQSVAVELDEPRRTTSTRWMVRKQRKSELAYS